MLKKKAITVLTMSVVLSTAIGYSTPHNSVSAGVKEIVNLEQNPASVENARLVLNQKSGSNDVSLVLEFGEEYNKSVTSFEVLIKLDYNKIKNVTMNWNKEFKTNQCRYTYDKNTGELKLYVVEKKDLLNDRRITIGNMRVESDETTNFTTYVILDELKTVDLQHSSDVVIVDRTTHNVEFTVSELPPSTDKPTIDKPTTDKPTTDKPTIDKPTTDKPTTDKPTTDKPTTDKPTTGEPTTDKPTTDKPTTDEPTTDKPSTDKPTTDNSATDKPTTDNSATDNSTSGTPSTDQSSNENSSIDKQETTPSDRVDDEESDEENIGLTQDESLSVEEIESVESQQDTLESNNSEITTESQKGEATEKKVGIAMIIIACTIVAILVASAAVFLSVKVRKGKFLNKYQEQQKTNKKDE